MTAGEGGWSSGGGCLHLSPGSFVSEQVVPGFLCPLHTFLDCGPQCHSFPGVGANVYQLSVSLAEIFELEVWSLSWVSALTQFTIQYVLKDVTWILLTNVPSHLGCPWLRMTNKLGMPAHLRTSVLPRNVEDAPDAVEVEAVRPLFLNGICCLGIAAL